MAISLTAEAIILAINSAIKLGKNLQRAYAKSAKSKTIFLPLPKFDVRPNADRAHRFFRDDDELKGGQQFVKQIERLEFLFKKFDDGLLLGEQEEYVDYYETLSFQLKKDRERDVDHDGVNTDDLVALLRVKQWEDGSQPRNTPLKMVAGTLVEIGIDYFNQVPGALNVNSTFGKTMRHFLTGMDRVEFSETEDLRDLSKVVVPRLFIAAAEVVKDLSDEITKDEKLQAFIEATTAGIAKDVFKYSKRKDDEVPLQWGQLLMRSMVKNAGYYVFEAPGLVFNTNEGVSEIIEKTGGILMDIILNDPDKINLQNGFNLDALDRLVKSTFEVIALHPELIAKRDGFRQIVVGVSKAMAEAGIQDRPDLLPELVRLILEHTASHLSTLMGRPTEGPRHLLVEAIREFLLVISKHETPGPWKPRFSKRHILAIANHILDEVVLNPEWVLTEVEDKKLLRKALEVTFDALSKIPEEERLNLDVLELLIQLNIRTIATCQAVLDRVPWGASAEKVVILEKALDLLFAYVFDKKKVAPGQRVELLVDLLEYVLEVLIREYPDERCLALIDLILFKDPNVQYSGGFNAELADALINAALDVLESHPDLLTGKVSLQEIISGVAGALEASSFRKKGVLPDLLRLVLDYTGRNLFLIVPTDAGKPNYLLLLALEELLTRLSSSHDSNHWQPEISWRQAMLIIEEVFDHLVMHPEWLLAEAGEDSLLQTVLQEVFGALQEIPRSERLDPASLEAIIKLSLFTAASSPKVLIAIKWGSQADKETVLKKALRLIFTFVFKSSQTTGGTRLALLMDLLDYILDVILAYHPDSKGLILIDLILFEDPDVDYSDGFDAALADELVEAGLEVLTEYPDLVTEEVPLKNIIVGISGALQNKAWKQAGLLPELARLILSNTAQNLQLLIPSEAGETRYLLVEALRMLLEAVAEVETNGEPPLSLTADELLEIVEELLDLLVEYPSALLSKVRGGSIYQAVLKSTFDALARIPKEQRLKERTLAWLLPIILRTAALHPSILDEIKWGKTEDKLILLDKVLDLILSYVFSADHSEEDRLALLEDLIYYVLDTLIAQHPNKTILLLLYLILFEDEQIAKRGSWDEDRMDDLVEAALRVIEAYPELITSDVVFQKIVRDTAGALNASKIDLPDLFPEMVRLVLLYSADHVELITDVKPTGPRYILAIALEECLRVITARPKRGKWKPSLSLEQISEIVGMILEAVANNPQWISRDKWIQLLLRIIFQALEVIPKDQGLTYEALRRLIQACLQAVSFRKQLLINVVMQDGSKKKLVLSYALEGLFIKLYDKDNQSAGTWTLTQSEVITAVIDLFLLRLSQVPASQGEVDKALKAIQSAIDKLNQNLAFSLEKLEEALMLEES